MMMTSESSNLAVLLFLVISLLMVGGCLNSQEDVIQNDSDAERFQLTYTAQGPLYISGLWPTPSGEYVGGAGEVTTVNVTLSPANLTIDALGFPVGVVNLTYEANDHRTTHLVHPQSGLIVNQKSPLADPLDWAWSWRPSGHEAFLGAFDELAAGEAPDEIEGPCCQMMQSTDPSSVSFHMALEETAGSLDWIPDDERTDPTWNPPSSRPIKRFPWDGHTFPEPSNSNLTFPLSEALGALKNSSTIQPCTETQAFIEDHEDWQATMGFYTENPGLRTDLMTEPSWNIILHTNDEEEGPQATVRKHNVESLNEGPYFCNEDSDRVPNRWVDQEERKFATYHNAWNDGRWILQPESVALYGVSIQNHQTPAFTGGILFDPYDVQHPVFDLVLQTLTIDLETGLLSWYASRNPPEEAITRPLPSSGPPLTSDEEFVTPLTLEWSSAVYPWPSILQEGMEIERDTVESTTIRIAR